MNDCKIQSLPPFQPSGKERDAYTAALLAELRKGLIEVGPEIDLTTAEDYSVVARAAELKSWIAMDVTGSHKGIIVWGREGERVQVCFDEADFRLVEQYLSAPGG